MNIYKQKIILIMIIFIAFIGSGFSVWDSIMSKNYKYSDVLLVQPQINPRVFPWSVRSVDTQVVSKHWENVSRDLIRQQVALIKNIGANYVAIGTPYNRLRDMRMWVEEIHNAGMNVWFRSHWNEWEGHEGASSTMKPNEYLDATYSFIIANKDLFKEGDSFTVCMEAEEAGIGLGKKFLNWDEYKGFLLDEIFTANSAFENIGLNNKVYTNWLSVNGWIVENIFDKKLVSSIGLITIDHYVGQSNTIEEVDNSNAMVEQTINDFNSIHNKFNVPLLVGEWGYQIFQPVSDVRQADVINKMLLKFRTLDYLVGVNYWVNMGNTAAIFGDQYGSNLVPRMGAEVIKSYFDPLGSIQMNK